MEDAIIKCAQYETRVNHITAEINAYKILNEASQRLKNEQADGEEYIVKYKTRFATIATINRKRIGYYCFITSYDGDILLGFVERLFTTSLFSYQLLQGINYLHRAGLIHGDIKMENIIIKKSPTLKATFIDFDLSVPLFSADTKDVVEPKLIVGGNLAHASPEIFCNIKHDPRKTDMWALGVLLYEILYKQTPFHHSLKEAEARNRLCDYMNKIGKLRDSQLKLPVPVTLTRYTSEQQELAILLLHEVYTMLIPRVEDRPTPKDYLQWRDSLPTITTKAYKLRWGINVDLPH
ncbi:kinase-like domain-containing protein [Syncephalis plumigaleata]|nr:kinase-like domain-containing protein [Syncephalis plumigaleata]